MIITFPVLISETVDKDILPYLLKTIERKFALDYVPILQKIVKSKLKESHLESKSNVIELILLSEIDDTKHMESSSDVGIQVIQGESNKMSSDQPYFITLRITTASRVSQDFVFGFKALALITTDAFKIFQDELDDSRYFIHRWSRKLLGEKVIWTLSNWYNKVFNKEKTKTRAYQTNKVLFDEEKERVVILSVNDLTREEFEYNDPDDTPISSDNLKDSRWSSLYLDDSLNKRIFVWDQSMPKFSNIITYDMLYKNTLNILPEQIDKSKQRNTSLFNKRAPMSWLVKKIFGI